MPWEGAAEWDRTGPSSCRYRIYMHAGPVPFESILNRLGCEIERVCAVPPQGRPGAGRTVWGTTHDAARSMPLCALNACDA